MIRLPDYDLKNGRLVKRKRHKFNAQKTEVDNQIFDSKAEAGRYKTLRIREQAGEITDLKLQPKFLLQAAFTDSSGQKQRAIYYKADFAYTEAGGRKVVEDVKGHWTETARLKVKLFLFNYPQYHFKEVTNAPPTQTVSGSGTVQKKKAPQDASQSPQGFEGVAQHPNRNERVSVPVLRGRLGPGDPAKRKR